MSCKSWFRVALAAGYFVLLGYLFMQGYLLGDATFWIGACLAPYILISSRLGKRTWRAGIVLILLLVVCFFVRATSIRYLLVLVSVVFMIETLYGKPDPLLIWLLLMISPLFRYVSEVFTFPIRLSLSACAGSMMRVMGYSVNISGNIIQIKGNDFAVDPACMGLQMLGFSFLAGIFLISHYQQKTGKGISSITFIVVMVAIFVLNLASNLMRIIVLVVFSITPADPMHDLAGIFSLVLYVLLPAAFLVRFIFKHFGKSYIATSEANPVNWSMLAVNAMLPIVCGFFILQNRQLNIRAGADTVILPNNHYKLARLDNGITRYRSENALVYIKGIPDFYSTDHNPYLCWKGSGYTFTSVREEMVSGRKIYFGTLKKEGTELQTAWWFANADHITISQLDWRWRVLKGEPAFRLINVTSDTKETLRIAVQEWIARSQTS